MGGEISDVKMPDLADCDLEHDIEDKVANKKKNK
jgi:hypothetical protein